MTDAAWSLAVVAVMLGASLAEVHPWLIEAAAWSAALAATFAALAVIHRGLRRPVRWIWGRLVADPVGTWVDGLLDRHTLKLVVRMDGLQEQAEGTERRVEEVRKEVKPNGGSSLRDVVDGVKADVSALTTQVSAVVTQVDIIETVQAKSAEADQLGRQGRLKRRASDPPGIDG